MSTDAGDAVTVITALRLLERRANEQWLPENVDQRVVL
jgi:hypothetical protein